MERRWETSSRPLFVKTVWDNGHRHVILGNEDPLAKLNELKKNRSRKSSFVNESSTTTPKSEENFNGEDLRITKMNYTITNQNQSKIQPLVENVSKINAPVNKSDPIELSKNELNVTQIKTPVLQNENLWSPYISCKNEQSNTLSERVLLWLDLTSEKFELAPKVKIDEIKKRAVTAHMCPNVRQNRRTSMQNKHQKSISAKKEKQPAKNLTEIEELKVVSRMEINENVKIESKKIKFDNSKRQLHIFLPNIPKRNNDCASTLSSKSSSLMSRIRKQ